MQDLERKLTALTGELVQVILAKNAAYGNSVFDPVNIFARGDAVSLLKMQIDHKLSRIARGQSAGEDTRKDLIAYLLLLEVAINEAGADEEIHQRTAKGRIHAHGATDRDVRPGATRTPAGRRLPVRHRPLDGRDDQEQR